MFVIELNFYCSVLWWIMKIKMLFLSISDKCKSLCIYDKMFKDKIYFVFNGVGKYIVWMIVFMIYICGSYFFVGSFLCSIKRNVIKCNYNFLWCM